MNKPKGYATLLLGLAILLASIAAAQAEMLNCGGVLVEPTYRLMCPASVPAADCQSRKLDGVTISNILRPKRPHIHVVFVWKNTKDYGTATLNGKRCEVPE